MAPLGQRIPDLLVVLDSSRSMEGHKKGTKTHKATLAAFKACQFAHSMGAELAAIHFSENYRLASWTRDLNAVEDVLVEFLATRTHIPGKRILELAQGRPGCLILCITDTHIQNLYQEWEDIKRASEVGRFVLFSIDPASSWSISRPCRSDVRATSISRRIASTVSASDSIAPVNG